MAQQPWRRSAPVPFLLALALVLAGPAVAQPVAAPAGAAPSRVLSVGSISLAIKEEIADFQPIADYLAERLGDQGVSQARVVVVDSLDAMATELRRGNVDVFVDSPFPVAEMKRRAGFRPLLRRWKKGVAEYHALVFVRADSPIRSTADLTGDVVAFDDPFSTSGYLLPKAMLAAGGLTLREQSHSAAPVAPGTVGYVFSEDDENTLTWVLKKRTAAGAIDNHGFEELLAGDTERFRVLARSPDVPRHVLGVRGDLEPALATALERVLLSMHEEERGREVLEDFQHTTRFDRFPEGPEAGMAVVERLMDEIQGELR